MNNLEMPSYNQNYINHCQNLEYDISDILKKIMHLKVYWFMHIEGTEDEKVMTTGTLTFDSILSNILNFHSEIRMCDEYRRRKMIEEQKGS